MTAHFGYTIFYVDDVDATLSFFTKTFDIARRFMTPEADYGELETGSTALAFAATELGKANLDPAGGFDPVRPDAAPVGASITLVTDDVAGTVERAVEHGAARYAPAVEKSWGQTVAYIRDPNGILVEVATPMGGS